MIPHFYVLFYTCGIHGARKVLGEMSCVTPVRNRTGDSHTPPRPEKRVNLRKRLMSYSKEKSSAELPPLSFSEERQDWVEVRDDSARAAEPMNNFKILSFNVWFVEKYKQQRCLAMVDIMREHDPIVCCLQEVTCGFLKVLKEHKWIRRRYILSHAHMATWDGYGVVLLIRRGHSCTTIKQYELPTDMGRVFITANLTIANERLEVVLQGYLLVISVFFPACMVGSHLHMRHRSVLNIAVWEFSVSCQLLTPLVRRSNACTVLMFVICSCSWRCTIWVRYFSNSTQRFCVFNYAIYIFSKSPRPFIVRNRGYSWHGITYDSGVNCPLGIIGLEFFSTSATTRYNSKVAWLS